MERKAYVRCPECDVKFDPEFVKFINIESDVYEKDLMTFECPDCKQEVKSWVICC